MANRHFGKGRDFGRGNSEKHFPKKKQRFDDKSYNRNLRRNSQNNRSSGYSYDGHPFQHQPNREMWPQSHYFPYLHYQAHVSYENAGYSNQRYFQELPRPLSAKDHVEISKELVRMLRHGKYRLLQMSEDGYINVDDILHDKKFYEACGELTVDHIREIVENNDKKRFQLRNSGQYLEIAATQGHTIQVYSSNLKPLRDLSNYPHVFHGTYFEAWEQIKETGLNRMKRNHIHFTSGLPRAGHVVSGMRHNVEVVIELDMEKAISDGYEFFTSLNGVILCEGDDLGRIHPKFFKQVFEVARGKKLTEIDFEIPPDFDDEPINDEPIDDEPSTSKQRKRKFAGLSEGSHEVEKGSGCPRSSKRRFHEVEKGSGYPRSPKRRYFEENR